MGPPLIGPPLIGPPLIGLAHGSRHAEVGDAIAQVMTAVGQQTAVTTRSAFLDLSEPDLTTTASALAVEGYTQAVVVPLLFTAAFHATVDVPQAAREASAASGIGIVVTEILGTGEDLLDVLAGHAAASGIPAEAALLLYAVGSSDAQANAAVHELANRWSSLRETPVQAGFGTAEPRGTAVLSALGRSGRPVAIVPLFLAPGLLLDPMVGPAAEGGHRLAPPLGPAVAPVVARRYAEALQTVGATG